MLAERDRVARRSLYSGTRALRLCGRLRGATAIATLCCGLAVGGCSFQLHSLLASDEGDGDRTGSIAASGAPASRVVEGAPTSDTDLAYARAAALEALDHAGKDQSVSWQNPATGAGGNITPLATSYTESGRPCRDFLASYAHGSAHDWLHGAACRTDAGVWEVKSLKPFNAS